MANKEFKVKHGLNVADSKFVVSDTQVIAKGKEIYPDMGTLTINSTAEDFPVGQSFFSATVDGAVGVVTTYKENDNDTIRQIFQGSTNGVGVYRARHYNFQYLTYQKEYDASVYTVGMNGYDMDDLQYSGSDVGQYWISSTTGDGGNAFFVNANHQIEINGQTMANDGYQWSGLYFQWRLSPDSGGNWSFPLGVYPGDFDVYIEVSDFSGTPVYQPDNGLGNDFKMAWAGVLVGIWYDGPGPNNGEETGIGLCELADHPTLPDGSYWGVLYDGRYYNPRPDYDTFIPRNPSITSAKLRITMERDEPNNQTYYRYWYSCEQDDKGNDVWVNVVTKTDDDFFSDGHGATQGIMNMGEAGDFQLGVLGGADLTAKFNNYKFSAQNLYCDDGILEGTYISNASGIAVQPAGFGAWKDITTDTLYNNNFVHEKSASFGGDLSVSGTATITGDVTLSGGLTVNGYIDSKTRRVNIDDKTEITNVKGVANPNGMNPSIIDRFDSTIGSVTYDIQLYEIDMYGNQQSSTRSMKLNVVNDDWDGGLYVIPYNMVGTNIVSFTAEYDNNTVVLKGISTIGNSNRVLVVGQRQAQVIDTKTPAIEFVTNRVGYDYFQGYSSFSQYPDGNPSFVQWAYSPLDGNGDNGTSSGTYIGVNLYEPSLLQFDPKIYEYVTYVGVDDNYITDIRNISLLTNLQQFNASNNNLTSVDFTYNTNLYQVYLDDNLSLTSFKMGNGSPNAYNINLNRTSIESLNFNFDNLYMINVNDAKLKTFNLGVNNNGGSGLVYARNNPFDDPWTTDSWSIWGWVSQLDLGANAYNTNNIVNDGSLGYFLGFNNGYMGQFALGGTRMTNMDFSGYSGTFTDGAEIQLEYNQVLQTIVPCDKPYASWYVYNCPALTSMSFDNFVGGLYSLDIDNTGIVSNITAFGNMSGMVNNDANGEAINYFRAQNNLALTTLSFPATKITQMLIQNNPLLATVNVEQTQLQWFYTNDNPAYEPDFTYMPNVTYLAIGNTTYNTGAPDFSGMTNLNQLDIYNLYEDNDPLKFGIKLLGAITIVDVSSNTNLQNFILMDSPTVTGIVFPSISYYYGGSVQIGVGSVVIPSNIEVNSLYLSNGQGTATLDGCSISNLSISSNTIQSVTFLNNPTISSLSVNSFNSPTYTFDMTGISGNNGFYFGNCNLAGVVLLDGVNNTGAGLGIENGTYGLIDGSQVTSINCSTFYVNNTLDTTVDIVNMTGSNIWSSSGATGNSRFTYSNDSFTSYHYYGLNVSNNYEVNSISITNGNFVNIHYYMNCTQNSYLSTGAKTFTFSGCQVNGQLNYGYIEFGYQQGVDTFNLTGNTFNLAYGATSRIILSNSDMITINASNNSNTSSYPLELEAVGCYRLNSLDLTNSGFDSVNLNASNIFSTIVGISSMTRLARFNAENMTNDSGVTNGVPLSTTMVDQILNDIATSQSSSGISNGVVYMNESSRTTASDAAVTQLEGAGWTVSVAGVI